MLINIICVLRYKLASIKRAGIGKVSVYFSIFFIESSTN